MKDYYQNLSSKDKKLYTIVWLHLLVEPMTLKDMLRFFCIKDNQIKGASDLHHRNKLSVLLNNMLDSNLLNRPDKKKISSRAKGGSYYTGRWDINEDVLIFEDIMKDTLFNDPNFKSWIKENIEHLIKLIRKIYTRETYFLLIRNKIKNYEVSTLLMAVNLFLVQIYSVSKTVKQTADAEFIEHRVKGRTIYDEYADKIIDEQTYEYFKGKIAKLTLPCINRNAVLDLIMSYFKKLIELKHKEGKKLIKLKKRLQTDFYDYVIPKGYSHTVGTKNITLELREAGIPVMIDRLILCYNSIIARYYYQINGIELPEENPEMFGFI